MIIEQSSCLCGGLEIHTRWVIEERRIGDCIVCGLIRTLDVPLSYEKLYTNGLRYHGDRDKRTPYVDRFDHDFEIARIRLQAHLKYFNTPPNTLLDVGCANGAFLINAAVSGILPEGIEPNPSMAAWIRKKAQIPVHLEWPFNRRYDMITYHDVLEHIRFPFQELQKARSMMRLRGMLIIDTPDGETLEGSGAHHLKPIEHLWYFREKDLKRLLQDLHFQVVAIERPIPGKIVAYAFPAYEGV